MALSVKVSIDTHTAILAGYTTLGVGEVIVDDAFVAGLSEDERRCLAEAVIQNEVLGNKPGDPSLPKADREAVKRCLKVRVENARQLREVDEQQRKLKARQEELAAVKKREEEAQAAARKMVLHKWISQHGTDSQKKRWKQGLLPEKEALDAVREEIFAPLEGFTRYTRMKNADICECDCAEHVDFLTDEMVSLSAEQYEQWEEILNSLPKDGSAGLRRHHGMCPNCDCEAKTYMTALVTVDWQGIKLSREYVLDASS